MLLKIGGYELEIVQGKFVCLEENNGEISHFIEWRHLDPKLQKKFKAIRKELSEFMEEFIRSGDKATFEAISEAYKKDQTETSVRKS